MHSNAIDDNALVLFTNTHNYKKFYISYLELRKAYNEFFGTKEDPRSFLDFSVSALIPFGGHYLHNNTTLQFFNFLEEYKQRLDFEQKLDKILE